MNRERPLKVGIVGPCAAGKTTLAEGLKGQGVQIRQIAQEHSFVPDMWLQISNPDILIYLDVSHEISIQRRPQNFSQKDFDIQVIRLKHARKHADLYLCTDAMGIPDVLNQVISFLFGQ